MSLAHVSFECIDALNMIHPQFDVASSTLCLHELPEQKACKLLKFMLDHATVVLIANYTEAKTTATHYPVDESAERVASMLGTTCWKNRPHARKAIEAAILCAKNGTWVGSNQ